MIGASFRVQDMLSITCSTCMTVLNVPEGRAPEEPVICPNCGRRFWLGSDSRSAQSSPSTYWDELPIDDVLAELNLAPSQPAGEDRAGTLSPDPVTTPAA